MAARSHLPLRLIPVPGDSPNSFLRLDSRPICPPDLKGAMPLLVGAQEGSLLGDGVKLESKGVQHGWPNCGLSHALVHPYLTDSYVPFV